MEKQHFLLNEVAKRVGQKPYQLAYLITIGVIEEPKLRISNKRIFSTEDIERIRQVFRDRACKAGKDGHG